MHQLKHTSLTQLKTQFELELRSFPDKAFVQGLHESIANGVNIGYIGPHNRSNSMNVRSANGVNIGYIGPHNRSNSRNVRSADEHPSVIELKNATSAILWAHIIHRLGLGVVAKKTGGWRMIMYFSGPPGRSINDFIPKDDFTMSYSSVDDAVSLVKQLGPRSIMAKIDIKVLLECAQ